MYFMAGGAAFSFYVRGRYWGLEKSLARLNMKGALPRSKAGDKSTSLGIIPLFSRLNIPSDISSSVMGGGSAKGSSLKFFGKILLG